MSLTGGRSNGGEEGEVSSAGWEEKLGFGIFLVTSSVALFRWLSSWALQNESQMCCCLLKVRSITISVSRGRLFFPPSLSHPIYWKLLFFFSISVHVLFSTVHCTLFFCYQLLPVVISPLNF